MGWCKYFSQEMRAQFGGSQAVAIGPPGATLDLGFMTPGTLDSRITFTRASTATYTDASGTIQTAAINQPRWDYAGGVLRGLLIEDARTNLVVSSNMVTGWAYNNLVGTASPTPPPGNMATFTRLTETIANSFHTILNNVVITASAPCSHSVHAKAGETRYLQLGMDSTNAGIYATFDLQTGTVSGPIFVSNAGAAIAASVIPLGGGIYRCAISGTLSSDTAIRLSLSLSVVPNPSAFPGYPGNTSNGLLVWGGQFEQGSFPTSYIPTAGSSVTRSQDRCLVSSANMAPWFSATAGSWFVEFIRSNNPIVTDLHIISGPTEGNSSQPLTNMGSGALQTYDGTNWGGTANLVTANAVSKGCSTWTSGTGRVCLNGGAIASAVMNGGFAALSTSGVALLVTSPTAGSTNNMTGYFRRASFWPRVLSDAEMQQATT
jgi:hypothetical protein